MVSPLSAVCLCVCSCDVFKCVLVEPAVTSLQDTAGHNSRWHPGAIFTEYFTLPPGVLLNGTKKFWAKSFSSSEPFRELLGATFTGEWRTLTDYFLCYNPSTLPTVSKKRVLEFWVSFFFCKKSENTARPALIGIYRTYIHYPIKTSHVKTTWLC